MQTTFFRASNRKGLGSVVRKLLVWIVFSVLFSLVPLFLVAFAGYVGVISPIPLADLLDDGDLFNGAAGLSAAAVGELLLGLQHRSSWRTLRYLLIGFNLVNAQGALLLGFVVSQGASLGAAPLPSDSVAFLTLSTYASAVLAGGVSLYLSYSKESGE
jgi:hypothetical protein